jgi:hypothetical protein
MKALLTLLLAAVLAGCASLGSKSAQSGDCCGLTEAQWKRYDERAADAVLSPAAWRKVGARKPKGVQPASRSGFFGTTNSPDGVQPPTQVRVDVLLRYSGKDRNVVVVEFSHPDGKIKTMYATEVYYD